MAVTRVYKGRMCYFENKLHLIMERAKTQSVLDVGLKKHSYGYVQQYVQQSPADAPKEEHRETKGGVFNSNVVNVLTILILMLHLRVVVCKMPSPLHFKGNLTAAVTYVFTCEEGKKAYAENK